MLIITEKPSVARQFSKALGAEALKPFEYRTKDNKYVITHCVGHLLSLWEASQYDLRMKNWNYESLPVIPAEFRYNVIKTSAKVLAKIKELITEAVWKKEEIMIATDAGREGEVIARLVLKYAGAENYEKLSRFWSSESTAEAEVVKSGIEKRKTLKSYDKLAKTGMTWKESDWIYGINLTVLFTLIAADGEVMNTGRVQTAVLKEINKRQKEIENFTAKIYKEYEITTQDNFKALLIKPIKGREDVIFDADSKYIEKADKEIKEYKRVEVRSVIREKEAQEPPLLYNTSELQKEAYRIFGFSPLKTLELMQKLYEERGALSYPRTPSRVLGEGNEKLAKVWIEEQIKNEKIKGINKEKYTLSNTRLFNNEKLEDHFALVPLKYIKDDGSDEYKVWKLAQERFLMQGMGNYEYEKIKVVLGRLGYNFVGNVKNVVSKGWKELERVKKTDKEEDEYILPLKLREGNIREIKETKIKKGKTKPPLAYNYGTILAFMQNPRDEDGKKLTGIGTEATRAAHIKGLETHKLLINEKKLVVTEKGRKLLSFIEKCEFLNQTIEPDQTMEWEKLGEKDGSLLIEKTKKLVRESVEFYKGMAPEGRGVIGKCPICGKNIYEGKKAYFCERFKEDKKCMFVFYKEVEGIKISAEMVRGLLEGKRIKEKGRGGRTYELRLNENKDLAVKEAAANEKQ